MKRVLGIACLIVAATSSVFAQSTFLFNNRLNAASPLPAIDAAIYDLVVPATQALGDPGRLSGTSFYVAIFGGLQGTSTNSLVLLTNPNTGQGVVDFRTGNAAGYVNVGTDGLRAVQGITNSGFATLQVRAWSAAGGTNWDAAVLAAASDINIHVGVSDPFDIALNPNPLDPAQPRVVGLTSFAINSLVSVPEPSVTVLAAIGAVGLIALRRRK